MNKTHQYNATITWTGNQGKGTIDYRSYERSHTTTVQGKMPILGSSDPAFRGEADKYNPEELLVASLSSCHMLWYLHLCAEANVIVLDYVDYAAGTMIETAQGGGHFTEVVLNPVVTVADEDMIARANALHVKAHACCFIANSVNFPVKHCPTAKV